MAFGATLLALFVIFLSMLLPVRAGVNASVAQHLGHPLLAALANMTIGAIAVATLCLVLRVPLPITGAAALAPWWAWLGGIIGATFVFTSLFVAPKLGAAAYVSISVAGTMLASLVIDHYGLIGFKSAAITPARALGAVLVIGGMLMLQWKPAAS